MVATPRKTTSGTKTKKAKSSAVPPKKVDTPAPEAPPAVDNPLPDAASMFAGQIDLLNAVTGTTARIVTRAASILEEELASGIGVTQNIEQRFVDVDKLRSGNSQEVVQRFRKDAHDVVDILLDLVNVATNAVSGLSERAVSIGLGQQQPPAQNNNTSAAAVPTLAVPALAKAGQTIEIPMTLENESEQPIETLNFLSSDLVNTDGERIAAGQISFLPENLVIEPKKTSTITVVVRIPDNAAPGVYSGLLQATRMGQLRAVMSIQITA